MLSFKLEFIKWLCSDETLLRPLLPREAAVERVEDEAQARFEQLQIAIWRTGAREHLQPGLPARLRGAGAAAGAGGAGHRAAPGPLRHSHAGAVRGDPPAGEGEEGGAGGVGPAARAAALRRAGARAAGADKRTAGRGFKDCIAPVPAAIEAGVRWIKRLNDDQARSGAIAQHPARPGRRRAGGAWGRTYRLTGPLPSWPRFDPPGSTAGLEGDGRRGSARATGRRGRSGRCRSTSRRTCRT